MIWPVDGGNSDEAHHRPALTLVKIDILSRTPAQIRERTQCERGLYEEVDQFNNRTHCCPERQSLAGARLFRSSVARSKLLQEVGRSNKVARLEALGKPVKDRAKKFERFVYFSSISP